MSNLVKYGNWSDDQAATEKEEFDKSSATELWKVPVGKTAVRFAPPRVKRTTIYEFVWEHYIDVPGTSPGAPTKRARFVCPLQQSKAYKQPARFCPSDIYADRLRASGNQEDYDLAKDFLPQRKVYASILVRGQEDKGWRIWPFGKQVYDQLDIIRRDARAGGNFADPIHGFDILVTRVGQGANDTKYTLLPCRESPLIDDAALLDALLESMPDLSVQGRMLPDAEVRKLWQQAFPVADVPVAARSAPRGRSAPQPASNIVDDAIDTTAQDVMSGVDD